MASNNSSDGLTNLLRASGLGQSGSVAEQLTSISNQLQQLRAANDAVAQQTLAFTMPSSSGASGGGVLETMGGAIGGGLGISPLISGLLGLFGGGDSSSGPPPLVPFVKPLPINLNAGFSELSGGGAFAVDAAQGGSPRAVTSNPPAQITVQIQAMDSQSFLDRSHDIAMAVRQAMLETTVLNDVIREV